MDDLFSWVSIFQGRLYVEIRKWSRNYLWQVPSLCKNCSCIINRLTWFGWLFCTLEVEKCRTKHTVCCIRFRTLVSMFGTQFRDERTDLSRTDFQVLFRSILRYVEKFPGKHLHVPMIHRQWNYNVFKLDVEFLQIALKLFFSTVNWQSTIF